MFSDYLLPKLYDRVDRRSVRQKKRLAIPIDYLVEGLIFWGGGSGAQFGVCVIIALVGWLATKVTSGCGAGERGA